MKSTHILYPFIFLVLISCTREENPKEQFLKWAQKGMVTDNIQCKADASLTYCVYIPTSYDVSKVYPTIYAFDPHGSGRIPVNLIKNIADSLGYIVIGSNNSKNGINTEDLSRIVSTLFEDSQKKLAIDPSRIYLTGFSGGARVACMIAQAKPGIKGIIACSAGFQPTKSPLGFQYIGIAGTQDMNYLEMRQLNLLMDSVGIQNQLIVFNGKHSWPNQSTISEAIEMLSIGAFKDSDDKNLVTKYTNKNIYRINRLRNSNSLDSMALALDIAKRTLKTVDRLINSDGIKLTIEELSKNPSVISYLKEKTSIERYEFEKQKEFSTSFGSKTDAWWNGEIKKLKNGKAGLKGDVCKRLLGYISLNCYGNVNRALYNKDWKTAQCFVSIYTQVDPENPDAWYALACLQANTGKPNEAVESLKSAIRFGFSNYSKIQNDPLLANLQNNPELNDLTKSRK